LLSSQVSAVTDETGVTRCIAANVLQTKVDDQCDKLATELSNCMTTDATVDVFELKRSYLSKVANLNIPHLPHLHLALLLGIIWFGFAETFGSMKLEFLGYHLALSV